MTIVQASPYTYLSTVLHPPKWYDALQATPWYQKHCRSHCSNHHLAGMLMQGILNSSTLALFLCWNAGITCSLQSHLWARYQKLLFTYRKLFPYLLKGLRCFLQQGRLSWRYFFCIHWCIIGASTSATNNAEQPIVEKCKYNNVLQQRHYFS